MAMVGGSAPLPLIKIHQMIPLSVKFISLDSTFNVTPIHIIQFLLKNPVSSILPLYGILQAFFISKETPAAERR
jgi:hypothetical protein